MIHTNIIKAFKFFIMRPLQRFNIENRAKKYLGPEAEKFKPAPRLISPLQEVISLPKEPNNFTIEAANNLNVLKIESSVSEAPKQLSDRPLPKQTKLDLDDPRCIWHVDKVPPGRLSLDSLEELMLNQLGDPKYWTPEKVADHYKIKVEYVEKIISHLKQVRIIISPNMKMNLDYVGKDNPKYQATKHLIYRVDPRLRTKKDRQFDKMYLPDDKLPEQVAEAIDHSEQVTPIAIEEPTAVPETIEGFKKISKVNRLVARTIEADGKRKIKAPEPLRIKPVNIPGGENSHNQKISRLDKPRMDRGGIYTRD